MEILSVCTGRAWRARVTAADSNTRDIVERIRVNESIPAAWRTTHSGSLQLVGPRDFATEDDSLVDVFVEGSGSHVRVAATLNTRTTLITNATSLSPADPRWTCRDYVRLATMSETVELGLRWTLGWGHLGCIHIDEFAFWGTRTNAVSYVVDNPQVWLAAGAPLPERHGRSAFLAYCGPRDLHDVVQAVGLIDDRDHNGVVGGGMFPNVARSTRVLLAIAEVEP